MAPSILILGNGMELPGQYNASGLGPREGALMCYDETRQRIILFCGADDKG